MDSEEILERYRASYDAPQPFDPKHPEDPTVSRRQEGLPELPLDGVQTAAVCDLILRGKQVPEMLDLLLNRVAPGTGASAKVKADFLGKVAVGEVFVPGLTPFDAIKHLGYMKGGHNVPVLIGLLEREDTAKAAKEALSRLVLIHNAIDKVAELYRNGNKEAQALLRSWAKGEWYSCRPEIPEKIRAVIYKIPDDIEASTDFLSHSKGGHTRTDIPKHGKRYFMTREMLEELEALKASYPDRQVVLAADKIGTSSSRKSGMNNVEWNTGIENEDTRYVPDKRVRAVIFAGRTLGPIFAKTAQDMGSVILRTDTDVLKTGDLLDIRLAEGKAEDADGQTVCTFSFSRSDAEILRANGGTNFRMGKILSSAASKILGESYPLPYEVADDGVAEKKPMTAAQKIIAAASGRDYVSPSMTVYAKVGTVASQDTTGGMTVQELQGTLAAMNLAVPLFLQSQCHNAAMGFRTPSVIETNGKLADFVKGIGGVALNMGDGIIHSWLNEVVMPNSIVVGGDSHTRVPTALSFPLGSGGVAEAAATGVTEIVVPESVLVVLKGSFRPGIFVRDLVNYIPYKAKKLFGSNSNIFEGKIIEFRREEGKEFDMIDVFRLTNSSAERSATAAYFEQSPQAVADYLKTHSIPILERLISEGFDNDGVLSRRVEEMREWGKSPEGIRADDGADYAHVLTIDLSEIEEPYAACPHTPDNVKPLSELSGTPVEFCFVGSCMSGYEDFKDFERITSADGATLKSEVWMTPATRLLAMRLESEGITGKLKARGVRFEVPGCSLCMGNQERVIGKKNVASTSTRNFKGRMGDEASVYLTSSQLCAVISLTGSFPNVSDYFKAVRHGN